MNFFRSQILIDCTIFIIVTVEISNSNAETIKNVSTVCHTSICQQMATSLINSMDENVNPCDNFYQYACGNFLKKNTNGREEGNFFTQMRNHIKHQLKEILESPSLRNENVALRKSKQSYKACMDTNSIESRGLTGLTQIIDKLGGWPMTLPNKVVKVENQSWQDVDLIIRSILGHSPLFTLTATVDLKNSDRNTLWLTPPIPLHENNIFAHEFLSNKNIKSTVTSFGSQKYRQSIVDTAKLFANNKKNHSKNNQLNSSQLKIDAKNIKNFEMELQDILYGGNVGDDLEKAYTKFTINNFQKICDARSTQTSNGKIDWLNYIQRLFIGVPNANIQESDEIVVVAPEYFKKLLDLLDKTPSRVIVNSIYWSVIQTLAPFTNSALRNITIDDDSAEKTKPRWKFCIEHNGIKHALAHAFTIQYFSPHSKYYILELVDEIIIGMKNDITRGKWLDFHSKSGALKKLLYMKKFIGYPDWYDEKMKISNYYKDINIGNYFFENTLEILKYDFQKELKLLRQPIDNNEWVGYPTDVNSFYYYPANSLTIPVGILQFPFFNHDFPDALNYGAIGFVIGHEISHGFDNIGSQYDEKGNIRNWWSNITESKYDKKAKCFIEQFKKYEVKYNNVTYHLDPNQTLSENIADTTGISALYKAFTIHSKKYPDQSNVKLTGLQNFDSKKLIFLAWAHSFCARPNITDLIEEIKNNNHSPLEFRVNGALSNVDAFSDTYECVKGTKMNPVDKCNIWQ